VYRRLMVRKIRVWRFLEGKPLREVARELRLPAYVVSAIERGEVEPSPRWIRRFEEVYGPEVAAELLAPVDAIAALGPAIGSLHG
jgi:transcriptional regulator with XRE-family HTH domain